MEEQKDARSVHPVLFLGLLGTTLSMATTGLNGALEIRRAMAMWVIEVVVKAIGMLVR